MTVFPVGDRWRPLWVEQREGCTCVCAGGCHAQSPCRKKKCSRLTALAHCVLQGCKGPLSILNTNLLTHVYSCVRVCREGGGEREREPMRARARARWRERERRRDGDFCNQNPNQNGARASVSKHARHLLCSILSDSFHPPRSFWYQKSRAADGLRPSLASVCELAPSDRGVAYTPMRHPYSIRRVLAPAIPSICL